MKKKKNIVIAFLLILIISSFASCELGDKKNDSKEEEIRNEDTIPSITPEKSMDTSFIVMSCNLDVAGGNNTLKQQEVFSQITSIGPDLIGVQEENSGWKDYLKIALETEGYEHIFKFRGGPQGYDEASGIFYKVDRFTLVESGYFWLSSTPDVFSVATDWGALYPRICTWVLLQDKKSGKEITYYNTHFSYVHDVPVRKESSNLIISRIQEKNIPAIFTGDLNFWRENEEETYTVLTSNFDDSYVYAEDKMQGCTFHDYGKELTSNAEHPQSPIDYIFTTKGDFQAESFKILTQDIGSDFYSDHFFVYSKINYKDKLD